MNQSVNPTVTLTGLTTDPYTCTAQAWTTSTVFKCNFTFVDDNEDNTATINISGAEDVAENTMSEDTSNSVYVDTENPIGTITVDTDPIYELDLVQIVTITYAEAMDAGSTPTIAFSGNSSTITTQSDGAWSVQNTVWTETFDVADENEETDTVWVSCSGATDGNGNAEGTSTNDSFEIDTVKPTITALTVSDSTITDADAGATLWVNMTFSEDMNTSINPAITFNADIAGSGTLTYVSGTSSWDGTTMFNATYTIADVNETQSGVDVIVNTVEDAAGNVITEHTESDQIDVDTTNPWVTDIVVSDSLITEADDAGTFYVNVTFSESMTTGVNPIFTFTPDVATSGTLTYADKTWGSTWVNASFTIADINETQSDIDIAVTNVSDSNSNSINTSGNSVADKFSVDTEKPTIGSLIVSDSIISDSNVGDTFYVNVTFNEDMSTGTNPTFTFDGDVVGSGSLTNAGGSWISATLYAATWTIADVNETEEDIDIQVSLAKDEGLNTMEADTEVDKFTVSTANPTFDSAEATATNTIEVTFSEYITVVNADGSNFTATGATITGASAAGAVVTLTTSNDLATDYTANDLRIDAGAVLNNDTNPNLLVTGQTISDGQAPTLDYAVMDADNDGNSQSYVDVYFSEELDDGTVATGDFDISISGISVSGVTASGNLVTVQFSTAFETGNSPEVEIIGSIEDTSGNAIDSGTLPIWTYRISMAQGWNLISIPGDTSGRDISVVLPDDFENNVTKIWGYNADNDSWAFWRFSDDDDRLQLEPGKGYWINMTTADVLTGNYKLMPSGGDVEMPEVTIKAQSWNLIGHWRTWNQSANISGALSDLLDTEIASLYEYSPTGDTFIDIYDSGTMQPGKGYWLSFKGSSDRAYHPS
jgi:hypothetical protein